MLRDNESNCDSVAVSPSGSQVAETEATAPGAGAPSGLEVSSGEKGLHFQNDAADSLRLLS